ncbi:MAG: ATPase [Deltaproteobacteria bacterium]|nr:ATPase [Deltaproteobacteria bacterium]
MIYAGVDVGSSTTKVVLMGQEKNLLGWSVQRSGTDFAAVAEACLKQALRQAGLAVNPKEIKTISTGYGRKNVGYTDGDKTEISCHARGCYYYFPEAITIIDIGGQDNKVIQLDEKGRRINFKMNRKCAAGTGAFLEEMALRLNIPLEDLNDLARQSREAVELGSFCTVFTATEVLEKIRHGKKVADIVKGLFLSVIKRVLEMDLLSEHVVITGGVVAYNPYLKVILEEHLHRPVWVPRYPQLTGAIGAALFARETFTNK